MLHNQRLLVIYTRGRDNSFSCLLLLVVGGKDEVPVVLCFFVACVCEWYMYVIPMGMGCVGPVLVVVGTQFENAATRQARYY